MRNFKAIVLLVGIVFFGIENTYGQSNPKQEEEATASSSEVPDAVKAALKNYSNYKIGSEVFVNSKSNTKVFKFKMEKGIWVNYLLIDEKGKILGIESGEGKQ